MGKDEGHLAEFVGGEEMKYELWSLFEKFSEKVGLSNKMVESYYHILAQCFFTQILDGLFNFVFLFFAKGDNILAVLKYLATSDVLVSSSKYRHGNMVFFDVLGLFVIAYPSRVGSIINCMVVMAAVLYLGKKLLQPKHNSEYFPLKLQSWHGYRICLKFFSQFAYIFPRH